MSDKQIDWGKYLENTKVQNLPIGSLTPNPDNPRIIKGSKFKSLMRDINRDEKFLIQRPILVNRVGNVLIIYAGHQRWEACKQLGFEQVPVSVSDNLSSESMHHRMILDNIHFGVWDSSKLKEYDAATLALFDLDADLDDFDTSLDKQKLRQSKGRVDDEGNSEAGKHMFSLIFESLDDKEEFEILALNAGDDGQRFEDWLLVKLRAIYDSK